jgi:hypothetical protein
MQKVILTVKTATSKMFLKSQLIKPKALLTFKAAKQPFNKFEKIHKKRLRWGYGQLEHLAL